MIRHTFRWLSLAILCVYALSRADLLDEKLRQHENYLASDAREGRGIGTRGLNDAADYLAAQFKEIGLQPAFDKSYFQPFEMGWGVTLGPDNRLILKDVVVDTSSGIMPIGFSSAGKVTAPVVFVGYGITAPEYSYDDFAGINVTGKIALCLTGEPGEFDTS